MVGKLESFRGRWVFSLCHNLLEFDQKSKLTSSQFNVKLDAWYFNASPQKSENLDEYLCANFITKVQTQ